jgi:hypothetical protein
MVRMVAEYSVSACIWSWGVPQHWLGGCDHHPNQLCFLCHVRLPFLCAVWKFHKNPIKPRFICAASSSSLTDVSKWLCSFFKAMFPTVNDLWVSKLEKADVPCDSSWILNDYRSGGGNK